MTDAAPTLSDQILAQADSALAEARLAIQQQLAAVFRGDAEAAEAAGLRARTLTQSAIRLLRIALQTP